MSVSAQIGFLVVLALLAANLPFANQRIFLVGPQCGTKPLHWRLAELVVLYFVVGGIGLAIYAVLMSLIGAFYYLRVVKVMYFDEPVTATTVSAPADVRVVLSVNGLLVLLLGIVPGALMALCAQAVKSMLAL